MNRAVVFLVALFLSVPLFAGQLLVPEEYDFIQDAVDMAMPGDTISVGPGPYWEHIGIVGKRDIYLLSRNRQEAFIVGCLPKGDRPDGGGIFIMDSDSITIDGFVFLLCGFQGTRDPGAFLPWELGGAINVAGLMPPIKNLIEECYVKIVNNVFLFNFGLAGGAINVYGGVGFVKFDGPSVPAYVDIEKNIFALNFAGFLDKGEPTPGDKIFLPDGFPYGMGGAVCIWTDEWAYDRPEYPSSCEAFIRNNIFRANFAEITGAAIAEVLWWFDVGKDDRQLPFPIFSDIYNNTMVDNAALYGLKGELTLPEIGPDILDDFTMIGEELRSHVKEILSDMDLSGVSISPFTSDTDSKGKDWSVEEEGTDNTAPKDREFVPACVYLILSDTWLWNNIIAGNIGVGVTWDDPYIWKGGDKQDGIAGNLNYRAKRGYPFLGGKGGDRQYDLLLAASNLFGNTYGPVYDPYYIFWMEDVNWDDNPLLHWYRLQLTWGSPCIDWGWGYDKNDDEYDWDGTWIDQGAYGGPDPLTIVTWLPLHLGWNLASVPAILIPPYDDPESDYTFGDDFSGKTVNIYGFDEPSGSYFYPDYVGCPAADPAGGYMLGNYTEEYADVIGVPPILPHQVFVFRHYPNPYYWGWNLIGNPYPYWSFSTTPTKALFADTVLHFDSLGLDNVNYLGKWFDGVQYLFYPGGGWDGWIYPMMGFWVQVANPGFGSVTFPPHMYFPWWDKSKGSPVIAGDAMSGDQVLWDWRLRLSVKSGDLVDEFNYVGMSKDSRATSIVEFVPPLDEYAMLYIPYEDAGFQQLKIEDFESIKDIPVEVRLNTDNEEVELSWEFEGDVSGYEFILEDESGQTFDMAQSSDYRFANTAEKAEVSLETILSNPVLFLDRQIPGDVRSFNVAIKKVCTGIDVADFTGIEHVAPNPFTTSTTIKFSIAKETGVNLSIYDASGRVVRAILDETLGSGHYSYRWDGRDENGANLPSGIYFYRMSADGYEKMGKLVLVR